MFIEKARNFFQHFKIIRDLFADFRALNFHDHGAPVAHGGAMHLAERGGGQVFLLKIGKGLGNADAQFAGDDVLHLCVGKRFDLVLQTRERLQIAFRQKVWPAGKQLAKFDEGRPHSFQVVRQLLWRGLAGLGGR